MESSEKSTAACTDNCWQDEVAQFLLRSGFRPGDGIGQIKHIANQRGAGRTFGSVWHAMRSLVESEPERADGKVPDVDVKIKFTGLKPGEKLSEILSDEGEEVHPCAEGILEVRSAGRGPGFNRASLEALIAVASRGDVQEVTLAVGRAIDEVRRQDVPSVASLREAS